MSQEFYLTAKQYNVLDTVTRLNSDGSWIDLDQLLERVPHKTTKQALQFTVRSMVDRGLLEKKGRETRRGRSRVLFALSAAGGHFMSK